MRKNMGERQEREREQRQRERGGRERQRESEKERERERKSLYSIRAKVSSSRSPHIDFLLELFVRSLANVIRAQSAKCDDDSQDRVTVG